MTEPETWYSSRRSILVVPVLSFAGMFVAIFSIRSWPWIITGAPTDHLTARLPSVMFGLVVSAVLWGFGYIRRWTQAIGVVGTAVGAHAIEQYLDPHIPQRVYPGWGLDGLGARTGFFSWEVAIRFFFVASILFAVSLWMSECRPRAVAQLFVSISVAAIGSAVFALMDDWSVRVHWRLVFNGEPLGLLWQTTLAAFLGIALWISVPPDRTQSGL
jgi:hypothetical protein